MSDNKTQLLQDTINLFNMLGVTPGQGADGQLMTRIMAELDGSAPAKPVITMPRGRCPVCGCPNLMDCECDPNEQLRLLNL